MKPHRSSDNLLSKSFDNGFQIERLLHRNLSNVSSSGISYSGFLWKRSNLPLDDPDYSQTEFGGEAGTSASEDPSLVSPVQEVTARVGETDINSLSIPNPPQHHHLDDSTSNNTGDTTDQLLSEDPSEAFARAFLGVDMAPLRTPDMAPREVARTTESRTTLRPSGLPMVPNIAGTSSRSTSSTAVQRSKPIKFGQQQQQQQYTSSSNPPHARTLRHEMSMSVPANHPPDYTSKDGHIWRSRYCVLDHGVLYFYRYQLEAESEEAKEERQFDTRRTFENGDSNSSSLSHSPPKQYTQQRMAALPHAPPNMALAHSPMPSKLLASSYLKSAKTTNHLWEKRVHLDQVGSVRSADVEFEPNVFEMLAVGEEDSARLVLKAPDGKMADWLFEFHRSMVKYMQKFVEQLGSDSNRGPHAAGDIHHPHFMPSRTTVSQFAGRQVGGTSNAVAASYSSRYQHSGSLRDIETTRSFLLSHGHGRTGRRSKKAQQSPQTPSISIPSPESPSLQFQLSGDYDHSQNSTKSTTATLPTVTPHTDQQHQGQQRLLTAPFIPPASSTSRIISEATSTPDTSSLGTAKDTKIAPDAYVSPFRHSKAGDEKPTTSLKYVSPFKRKNTGMSLAELAKKQESNNTASSTDIPPTSPRSTPEIESESESDDEQIGEAQSVLGGCADPSIVTGSILDSIFTQRKASRARKVRANAVGYQNNPDIGAPDILRWQVGAMSECGIREFNEDSFIVSTDLPAAWNDSSKRHASSLFAIFDGHDGDHAARYAAEKLPQYIKKTESSPHTNDVPNDVKDVVRRAVMDLDSDFCFLCSQDGRDWESGATALVATVVNEELVVSNLGDSRGVMGCFSNGACDSIDAEKAGWHVLPRDDYTGNGICLWKELSNDHVPARIDEQVRVEAANGWITPETEIPTGQLRRIVAEDPDAIDILKRCLKDDDRETSQRKAPHRRIDISRVCGVLEVTRAIGDKDLKSAPNLPTQDCEPSSASPSRDWECPSWLPYPADHSKHFVGDLISSAPESQSLCLGSAEFCDEFLVMACDGLWDVMNGDDVIRIGRSLLYDKRFTAKKTAARLVELAIHLGSSDNITVIVVRFFRE